MNAIRRALSEMDISALRQAWAALSPHLPQPKTDAEAEAMAHHARTQADSMTLRQRAYSHRWLCDRSFPSGLPDHLKSRAERLYPKVVGAVGISVNGGRLFRPILGHVREAMQDAVLECYADGHQEPWIVKPRMFEAKARVVKHLLGVDV